jgi:short-subunit dehydrogenase
MTATLATPQRIVITGASRGIGRSIALRLAAKGISLVLQGRNAQLLSAVAKECESLGATTSQHIVSLDDIHAVEKFAKEITSSPVDVLINNAGIARTSPIAEQSITDWQETMTVNLFAPVILTKAVLPGMKSGSSIVNIASMSSFNGYPTLGSYCASKFALEGFTQVLRLETQERGIRVIGIYPASTRTDIWEGMSLKLDVTKMMSPNDIAEGVHTALSLPPTTMVRNLTIVNTRPL